MKYKKISFFFFCIIFFACSNSKNPYENDLGIKPEHLAEIDTAHYTLIKWEDSVINFGTMQSGDSANVKFKFTNIGKTLLFIFNVRTTCGCTITDSPKEPIAPGSSGFVTAIFKSGAQTGEIRKRIIVFTNTKNGRYSNLFIHGIVKPAGNN